MKPSKSIIPWRDRQGVLLLFTPGTGLVDIPSKVMADVMNDRTLMNTEVMTILKEKETQYGVQFMTVQMQSASPPEEVLTAIKDRMVAVQRQDQAQAEAAQSKTLADANLYAAQKQAEAEAYQITATAQANAEQMRLTAEAQQIAIRTMMAELSEQGALGEKFIEYLIAQELKENSKWVINGDSAPIVDLRE